MTHADPEPESPQRLGPGPIHGLRQLVRDFLGLDRLVLTILVTVPVCLTLLEYYGLPWHYTRFVERNSRITGIRLPPLADVLSWISLPGSANLRLYIWWGIACLVLLVAIPMCAGAIAGASPRKLGLRLKGTRKDAWVYAILYALFLPAIWLMSLREEFRATYPFFAPARKAGELGVDFIRFEVIYCLQFFAIEFFFRGFIVLGLKPRLGMASVLVMLAPYCMVHYYKPLPEAMGAIGAGLILGLLAWRTGTIIYGWLLHYAVALSMDLMALAQNGRL